jgi:Lar family restriction alleviation protein
VPDDSIELKPCPFCGSSKVGWHTEHDMDDFGTFYCIECRDCRGRGALQYVSNGNDCPISRQQARDNWNQRAP